MSTNETPESVAVELGRLNSALREVLAELGLASSTRESHLDRVLVVRRDEHGRMESVGPGSMAMSPEESKDLNRFCRMIVAGANLTGRVSLRVRLETSGPVFVRLWVDE